MRKVQKSLLKQLKGRSDLVRTEYGILPTRLAPKTGDAEKQMSKSRETKRLITIRTASYLLRRKWFYINGFVAIRNSLGRIKMHYFLLSTPAISRCQETTRKYQQKSFYDRKSLPPLPLKREESRLNQLLKHPQYIYWGRLSKIPLTSSALT